MQVQGLTALALAKLNQNKHKFTDYCTLKSRRWMLYCPSSDCHRLRIFSLTSSSLTSASILRAPAEG